MKVSKTENDDERIAKFMKLIDDNALLGNLRLGLKDDECYFDDYCSDEIPMSKFVAIVCYKQLVLGNFDQINASWIKHSILCNKMNWGQGTSAEQVKNLQETYLDVYSGKRCAEKFPKM